MFVAHVRLWEKGTHASVKISGVLMYVGKVQGIDGNLRLREGGGMNLR